MNNKPGIMILTGAILILCAGCSTTTSLAEAAMSSGSPTARIIGGTLYALISPSEYLDKISGNQIKTESVQLTTGTLNVYENAYGLGKHMDQYGRPVRYEVIGNPTADTTLLEVAPNAYGLGVGMDQFGRAVKTSVDLP